MDGFSYTVASSHLSCRKLMILEIWCCICHNNVELKTVHIYSFITEHTAQLRIRLLDSSVVGPICTWIVFSCSVLILAARVSSSSCFANVIKGLIREVIRIATGIEILFAIPLFPKFWNSHSLLFSQLLWQRMPAPILSFYQLFLFLVLP